MLSVVVPKVAAPFQLTDVQSCRLFRRRFCGRVALRPLRVVVAIVGRQVLHFAESNSEDVRLQPLKVRENAMGHLHV